MKKNIFITIEGVDGVGKTTVSKLLAEEINATYYKSPGDVFLNFKTKVESPLNIFGRYSFYRLAVQSDSEDIKKNLESRTVVSDRYIASTFVYHSVMDPDIKKIHNEIGILKPDFSFLLVASSKVRDQRILSRNESINWIEENSILLDKMQLAFLSMNLIIIDTDNVSPKDIVNKILNFIKKNKNGNDEA